MNKKYAIEWLQFAYKNLITAKKLYEINHYTDIIGIELQQALEKTLKSVLAFYNKKIIRTHKLLELIAYIDELEFTQEEIIFFEIATNYYKLERYPNPNYFLPPKNEIKEILDFTESFFAKVCSLLNIKENEIMQ